MTNDRFHEQRIDLRLAVMFRRLRFRIGGLNRTYFRFPVSYDTVGVGSVGPVGSIGARQSGCAVRARSVYRDLPLLTRLQFRQRLNDRDIKPSGPVVLAKVPDHTAIAQRCRALEPIEIISRV